MDYTEFMTDGAPTKPHAGSESLVGVNGNAYAIMGHVRKVLERAGASYAYTEAYVEEATSGDYDHLLAVSMRWLDATSDQHIYEDGWCTNPNHESCLPEVEEEDD